MMPATNPAAALRRFRVGARERDVERRRDRQCDRGDVGGGNRHASGRLLGRFHAQPQAVEAAVVGAAGVAELVEWQQIVESGIVQLGDEVGAHFLQGEHGDVVRAHRVHDFMGVGFAVSAVQGEHVEMAVCKIFNGSRVG